MATNTTSNNLNHLAQCMAALIFRQLWMIITFPFRWYQQQKLIEQRIIADALVDHYMLGYKRGQEEGFYQGVEYCTKVAETNLKAQCDLSAKPPNTKRWKQL